MAVKKTTAKKTVKQKKEKAQIEKAAKKTAAKSLPEKKEAQAEKKPLVSSDAKSTLHAFQTIMHPLITEKAINLIEAENKLVFIVHRNSSRESVKKAVEELYNVKVEKVNLLLDTKSRKKAFVKISKEFNAGELATRLGVL